MNISSSSIAKKTNKLVAVRKFDSSSRQIEYYFLVPGGYPGLSRVPPVTASFGMVLAIFDIFVWLNRLLFNLTDNIVPTLYNRHGYFSIFLSLFKQRKSSTPAIYAWISQIVDFILSHTSEQQQQLIEDLATVLYNQAKANKRE